MAARARTARQPDATGSRSTLKSELRPLVQAVALMLLAGASAHVQAAGIMNLGAATPRASGGAAGAGGAPGMPNLGVSPQQALQASQPSIRNLGYAAHAIAAQIAAQQNAAAAAAKLPSTVPNGLAPGGLQVANGVTFVTDNNGNPISQNTDAGNPLLWINANGPKQTVDGSGHVNVDVKQTGQNAVLTWETMNVGRQTTLNFDQSAGTQTNGANNWAVLNRINDPSGRPSQILGNITAQGAVYVINRNGVLFGAGSQVNVHSLVASSLNLLDMKNQLVPTPAGIVASNQQFLSLPAGTTGGLAYPESGSSGGTVGAGGKPNEVLGLGSQALLIGTSQAPGDVTIEQGASITTHTNGTASDGGFVLVAAPNVTNAGSISATSGQVVLAAGVGVSLRPNGAGATGNPQVLLPELSGQIVTTDFQTGGTIDVTPAGTLTNTGIVQAARGNVNLLGSRVAQNGVVGVTTSVNTPGTITISTADEYASNNPLGNPYTGTVPVTGGTGGGDNVNRAGLLSFGPGSVTTVLSDNNGQTATSTPGTTFTPGGITMTAGSVWFQGGSLIEAPGSNVSVTAYAPSIVSNKVPGQTAVPGRIYVDDGATIDVSGLANVQAPISQTLVTIDRIGQNELADSPLLRNSFLFGLKGVVVDSTLTGTRSDGVQWVGSPILNLSGYVNLIPRTVDQLLTNGGTITLSGNEVMTATGSSMNLNGGYVHYNGGMVNTTRLVDANGAIVPIGQASPYERYIGIAGQFVESHPRWGVTKSWFNPLQTGGTYQSDYIVGGNAGTLDLFASQALVLDGDISAQAFGGAKQMQGNSLPSGGTFNLGADPKLAGGALAGMTWNTGANPTMTFNGISGFAILQDNAPQLGALMPGFSIGTPIDKTAYQSLAANDPNNLLTTQIVPVAKLNSGSFANLNVSEDKNTGKGIVVAQGTQLNLQPGGSISLNSPAVGADVNVAGRLSAPSGSISITSGGNVVVGPQGAINAAGQWVNNDVQAAPGTTPGNSQFINGGSISLSAKQNSTFVDGVAVDATGSILLQPGSVLDVSSGGEMLANGQLLMQNGVPAGRGGNVTLQTYAASQATQQFGHTRDSGSPLPATQPVAGTIAMGGTILSEGFSGGGTLTLEALGFRIGGDRAAAAPWDVYLPENFFSQQGFGKYVLNAYYDSTVAPGAAVALTQLNRIPDALALQQTGSGANLSAGSLTTIGQLDAYHRQPTNLVLTGGSYVAWQNGPDGPPPSYPGVTGAVTLSSGASINADAGASIALASPKQVSALGSVVAPGGAIVLSADTGGTTGQPGQFNVYTPSNSRSVWLGSDATLDVSGVALANPLATPVKVGGTTVVPNSGKVLPGGSVTLSSDAGYVVAQTGSTIDVSGTSANFDRLQANGTYASQPVWSDAGSITLSAAYGLFADGTLAGHGGASQARGGTLAILPHQNSSSPGATALVVRQSGTLVPAGLAPGQDFSAAIDPTTGQPIGQPTGVIQFAADRLNGSGIANLVLGDGTPSPIPAPVPPIAFAGNVNLTLPESVTLNAGRIAAIGMDQLSTLLSTPAKPAGGSSVLADQLAQPPANPLGTTVTINAPYVALVGPIATSSTPAFAPVATLSDATLNVNASFLDLRNQIQLNNIGQANLASSGDIRLSSTSVATSGPAALAPGMLYTPGNVSFNAADVYPATGSTFIVDAVGPVDSTTGKPAPTTVTFGTTGSSGTPLSAGGTLLVDATNIVQGGNVRAPSGTLVFGVGDPTNAATQKQFGNLPLVATDSVTFANGSVTSVSNGGSTIPYGTTIDGVEWQFNPLAGTTASDLNAPPAKYIGVNGTSVALNKGATIDLSGGGDLQAAEWVPGTGGTRDVLSQYNVSYASGKGATAVPVNAGAGNVYAIVPGAQSPVAAYDPLFAQSIQPDVASNGTPTTQTVTLGVGQAGMNDAIGKAVYLSGVPGLAAGYYTLLPGKYATLPGAYRVTVSATTGNVVPGAAQVLPDGTVTTAGYFADAVTGGRSATPTLFNVQSGAVWQQYSQYTLKGANDFFTAQAAKQGNVTPPLPVDAGQLVLAATKALTLGATLNAVAGAGGAPAEVDIASRDIQITGNGSAALPGYLQIGGDALDSLTAGSLLIGGTRAATTKGVTITPIANSVVVSNDANTSLKGPEILLVTKTDASGTDSNAANGLRVDAGASIVAAGDYPAAKDQPITIAGDGALLRVSNGAMAPLTRTGGTGTGLLTVGAGATLSGGQALMLDSSGNLKVDPSAVLSAKAITADGSAITFTNATGAAAANLPGFVIDQAGLAQLSNADLVTLRSYGAMGFVGDVNATFGKSVDLSAGTFTSDGGRVTLNGQQIAFTNETGAPNGTVTPGNGTLTVNAKEIDFGTGTKALSGFSSANMTASGGIVGQGTGTFDFGALPVTLNAPVYLADTSSASTVKTTGALTLNGAAGTALTKTPVGGAWHFVGGTLADNGATIAAPAGNVSLEATTGNLTIGSGSTVSAAGVSKQFFDVTQYAPAGSIILTADAGTVDVQSGTTLDFSGAKGGGAAGNLTLSAPKQVVNLNGTIKGGATNGYAGGSLSLDTAGAADLDSLAKTLASSGVNQSIAVHTKSGNLTLSAGNALTARSVSLTADGGAGNASDTANGNVNVLGTIDASGKAGGQIDLYGRSGVDVEGTLLARGSDPTQRGGKVNIGTSAVFDPTVANPYNATYGYENIDPSRSGLIRVGADALIDVSGGTAGGLSGGTVNFRAPLLADGSVDVQLPNTFNSGKGIVGSRATTLEAYATWSTTDATSGAQHFDGIVDPAGWYDSKGHLLGGTFTAQGANPPTFTFAPNANGDGGGTLTNNATGAQVTLTGSDADIASLYNGVSSIGFPGASGTYFVPTTANADHQNFYGGQIVKASDGTLSMTPGTLMGFIQSGLGANGPTLQGSTGNIANFRVAPGIEFDNPSTAINSGNISILSNWNLGAGLPNNSGTIDPSYRYNRTIAPMLTFRATNNFDAEASITDGFFQSQVATILGAAGTGSATGTYAAALALYNSLMSLDDPASISVQFTDGSTQSLTSISKDSTNPLYDPNVALTAPLQNQAPLYYSDYLEYGNSWGSYYGYWASGNYAFHIMPYVPLRIPAPVLSNYASYQDYANAYFGPGSWLFGYASNTVAGVVRNGVVFFEKFGTPTPPVMSSKPGDYGQYIALYGNYLSRLTFTKSPNFAFVDPRNAYSFFYAPASPLSIPNTGVNIGALPGNTAANVATKDNPLPISYAALLGGQSTSYRIVGGADLASANPLAVQPNAALDSASVSAGNVTLNQHTAYVDSNGLTLLQPTTIRTGTGSIDIAAANDFTLADTVAPGVVYTAGAPAQGSPTLGLASAVMNGGVGKADILVTPAVNPDSAGDISIRVQGDINGLQNVIDATGAVTGGAGNSISQYWWQWMQITAAKTAAGNVAILAPLTRSSIDFGAFDQGVMSVGGNVSISAGGNISDLAVSLPTTWYLDGKGKPVTVGGGNLAVRAGADILSGDYFVAKGTGTISAGGSIGSDITTASRALGWTPMAVSTVLAAQDGVFDVVARQGVDIGAVLNPSYASSYTQSGGQPTPVVTLANYGQYPDGQGYSPTSAVNVISTTGDVRLGTLGDMWTGANGVLPGSVNLTAFSGAIDIQSGGALYPSAVGQLNLVADQSVYLSNAAAKRTNATLPNTFGLSDADPLQMPSPTNPQVQVAIPALTDVTFAGHATSALHRDDTQPVRIYGLNGSIVNGTVDTSAASDGFYSNLVTLSVDKPALVQAGQDIVNLAFWGQNLRSSDVTRVVAGRDIYDTPIPDTGGGAVPVLVIGGPGWFDVQAGRNIGPLTSRAELYNQQAIPTGVPLFTGIDAVGNANNPNLPRESANVNVLFGVGPGVDLPGFISTYIAPGSSVAGVPSATPALVAFMEQYDAGALGVDTGLQADKDAALARVGRLTADDAWKQFKALPSYVQQLFAEKVLFGVLAQVGADFNDPASRYNGQYSRGYQAINTLFPASFGYTANNLGGGSNGANKSASTGNLDIRSTTIQTQQGGDVTILGPGGQALVGSTMAPPQIVDANGKVVAGPGTMGILTLEKGNVDIFTDQSVLLAQSRIFTEQGGDMTIWSSNGDINAGKGAKTSADTPAPQYVCDANHYCTVDSRGQVTGAGIATLQSIPGAPKGTVNLIAPRGTVDAGDAGIRAGNLNVAALRVVNADNIQVTGKATGIPLVQAVNTGALTAASSAASAASQVAQDIARNNASGVAPRRWTISVQVEGFGDNGPDGGSKRRKSEQIGYDSSNSVSLLGFGATGPTQRTLLSKDELGKLNRF
ncbi:TPA: filamentous hemagglutinin family protein [Burkholderia stabilis]|nr:filamentous hemagglutinin family protein [Burkholderia stabilis]HDR9647169.1 filamentous hemagglutinin family protein [Burkholderia stabilis]HDR9654929.1 filamentous hemagglutinin family protein [Burkholderia stabilis]HDR9676845.1 filamentous hemagglutinin family protein [Burkholderia stabilis]